MGIVVEEGGLVSAFKARSDLTGNNEFTFYLKFIFVKGVVTVKFV